MKALTRYIIAFPAVGAAMLLTLFLRGHGDTGISPQFFAAVLLVTWYGGLGPGLLATALSGMAAVYLLSLSHANSVDALHETVLRSGVFTVVALLTNALHAATRQAAEQARRAQEAAEAANVAKSKFLALVSHELRAPLGPVLMATEMLLDDPALPASARRDVQTIQRNIGIQRRLVDDLVDLARIESGKMRFEFAEIDAHAALEAAIETCTDEIRAKKLTLNRHFDAHRTILRGDAVRLRQAFWNVVRNAVKFTPDGGTIDVRTRDAADAFEATVADNGIGIEPRRLPAIFGAFEQGAPDTQERFGGLGLGLAICHAIVGAHGGSVAATSEGIGRGAAFTISLPAEPHAEPAGTDAQAASGGALTVAG